MTCAMIASLNFTVAAMAYRDFGVVAVWLLAIILTIISELCSERKP